MSDPDRDMRDLLVAISTKIDVVIGRQDDHEGRIRDLYQRLAELPKKSELIALQGELLTLSNRLPDYVTKSELKSMRTHTITVVTAFVLVVGGIVGLVAALT